MAGGLNGLLGGWSLGRSICMVVMTACAAVVDDDYGSLKEVVMVRSAFFSCYF